MDDSSSDKKEECANLLWNDEFNNEQLNELNWEIMEGDGCNYGICNGWGNGELEIYKKDNIFIENNQLIIEARKEKIEKDDNNVIYTSGRMRSLHKFDMDYGVIEARIRIPEGQGLWPAFWMLPSNDNMVWPHDGEIDIMENVGKEKGTYHGTIHYSGKNGNHLYSGTSIHPYVNTYDDNDNDDNFYIFSIEKQKGKIYWMKDGYVYFERSINDINNNNNELWPFENNKFHIIINLAIGGNWPGNPDDTTIFPQRIVIDYIRYYNKLPFGKIIGPAIVSSSSSSSNNDNSMNNNDVVYTVKDINHHNNVKWKELPSANVQSIEKYNDKNEIKLNFDNSSSYSGYLSVEITNNCIIQHHDHEEEQIQKQQTFRIGITVVKYIYSFIAIKDHHSDKSLMIDSSGTFDIIDNPDTTSSINASPSCLFYTRDSKSLFDTIVIKPVYIYDPMFYINSTLYLSIDLLHYHDDDNDSMLLDYSYDIILQLEDSTIRSLPDSEYPKGVHSRYVLHVSSSSSATNAKDTKPTWKRYYFNYFDQLDTESNITSIDTITLLFEPNTYSDNKFYFANLDTYVTLYDNNEQQQQPNSDIFLPPSSSSSSKNVIPSPQQHNSTNSSATTIAFTDLFDGTTISATQETTNLLVTSSFLIAIFSFVAFISFYIKYKRDNNSSSSSISARSSIVPWEHFSFYPNSTHEEIDDVNVDDITGMEIVNSSGVHFSDGTFS